jgi:two-component system, chemotaxis family, response regulator Rcp1
MKESLVIMLVEDNPADVFLIDEALRSAGVSFQIVHFEEGERAIQFVSSKVGQAPDLAILDLNVPNRDGLQVLNHIRADQDWQALPVIVLSSSPKDAVRGMLDADCYIQKPSSLEEFLAIGKEVVECYEVARIRRHPRPEAKDPPGGKV